MLFYSVIKLKIEPNILIKKLKCEITYCTSFFFIYLNFKLKAMLLICCEIEIYPSQCFGLNFNYHGQNSPNICICFITAIKS